MTAVTPILGFLFYMAFWSEGGDRLAFDGSSTDNFNASRLIIGFPGLGSAGGMNLPSTFLRRMHLDVPSRKRAAPSARS